MADLHDFETHRSYLTGLAYRMLGSFADAQDIVQEAYLRWHDRAKEDVRQPRAFLSKVVTRLSLDSLKSARRQRETYVGPWLPEPVVREAGFITEIPNDDPAEISIAVMLALEKLTTSPSTSNLPVAEFVTIPSFWELQNSHEFCY